MPTSPRRAPRARPAILLLVVGLALSLVGTPVGPAAGALPTAKVVWGKVPTTAAAGTKLTVTGSVGKGLRGQKVQLQKRSGASWTTVATGQLPRTRTFALRAPVTLGRNQLRVVVKPVPGKVRGSTSTIKVVQGDLAPGFTVSTLPPAFRNRMYNYFEGFGASGSWNVSIASGSLPPGIVLDEGYLDGTPTVAGSYTFTVRITAPGMPAAQRQFTLKVAPDGAWSHASYGMHALDNEGRFATYLCRLECFDDAPRVVDLTTGNTWTAPWPDDVTQPAAALIEDISGDGRYVLYFAGVSNWVENANVPSALYLWDRVAGTTVRISGGGPPLYSGESNGGSEAAVDADGSTVVYRLPGDGTLETTEVLVWERGEGSTSLSDHPVLDSAMLTRPEISDDGETVSFIHSDYDHGDRLAVFDLSASGDPHTFVTPPMDAHALSLYTLSADGETIAYPRIAGPDPDDPGYHLWETVVWDRATGVTQVVSESMGGAPMRTATLFDPPTVEVSGDGRFVYFESNGDYLENGDPSVRLPYFWDRASGAVTPMPLPPDEPRDWPDVYVRWTEPSYDGGVIFVYGDTGALYRFDRDPRP